MRSKYTRLCHACCDLEVAKMNLCFEQEMTALKEEDFDWRCKCQPTICNHPKPTQADLPTFRKGGRPRGVSDPFSTKLIRKKLSN